MAFTENAFKLYPLRLAGNARVWKFGGGNGNTTGVLVTGPSAILFDVFGNSFDSGTVTVQYATDNSTFAPLATATITYTTAAGPKQVAGVDVKTGFYRLALTGTAGTASDLVGVLIAPGAQDVQ